MRSLFVTILVSASLGISSTSLAQAPDSLSFQGLLTDSAGAPVVDGDYDLLFKMYKGSSTIWQQSQPNVPVKSGVFNVFLTGSVTWPLDTVAFNDGIDLGITVNAGAEMTPRTPLTSAAYALAIRGMYAVAAENGGNKSPHLIGGASNNFVANGVVGATIGGGGGWTFLDAVPNSVLEIWGTIGGGRANTAGGHISTVSGGQANTASGSRATVGGGKSNTAGGAFATVPGGLLNAATKGFSFAAGQAAQANHSGSFVWADSANNSGGTVFASTAPNQFLIRAGGGLGIGTTGPGADLHVSANSTTSRPHVLLQ